MLASKFHPLRELRIRVVRSFLDIIILLILRKKPSSGYDIFRCLVNAGIVMSPGTIYDTLHLLERKGYIEGLWDSRKKIYSLTRRGEEYLKAFLAEKESILEVMNEILVKA